MLYLNLDLLENINKYLYPLFYYYNPDQLFEYRIYSPMASKMICKIFNKEYREIKWEDCKIIPEFIDFDYDIFEKWEFVELRKDSIRFLKSKI